LDNETDAKVRGKQDRRSRTKRLIEKFDYKKGSWKLIEIDDEDFLLEGWRELDGQMKIAYLNIIITQNEIFTTGYNPRTLN
jgi:hypothetical protein